MIPAYLSRAIKIRGPKFHFKRAMTETPIKKGKRQGDFGHFQSPAPAIPKPTIHSSDPPPSSHSSLLSTPILSTPQIPTTRRRPHAATGKRRRPHARTATTGGAARGRRPRGRGRPHVGGAREDGRRRTTTATRGGAARDDHHTRGATNDDGQFSRSISVSFPL